jgi:hypothetical protein
MAMLDRKTSGSCVGSRKRIEAVHRAKRWNRPESERRTWPGRPAKALQEEQPGDEERGRRRKAIGDRLPSLRAPGVTHERANVPTTAMASASTARVVGRLLVEAP